MAQLQPEAAPDRPEGRTDSFQSAKGKISIQTGCSERFVATLGVDAGIGLFFHYRDGAPLEQQQVLRNVARMPEGNVVLAVSEQGQIIGYIAMHHVSDVLRWGQGDTTGYYEFGAIEVSRDWRGLGVAKQLLDSAFADDWFEDKIVISHELSWHWDLDATGMTKSQYRRMLYDLLSRVGFKEYPTDEGNIRMDSQNLFTARIGRRVGPALRDRFLRSLFAHDEMFLWGELGW